MSEGETDQAPGTQADWPLRPWMLAALLALAGMVVLSARVYRNSVLRTGARVRWRDALRTGRP